MNQLSDEDVLSEKEAVKEKLEDLKFRITHLYNVLPCLKQGSRLRHGMLINMCIND